MLTLRDLYVAETLGRLSGRHRRTRAPGDEGPRRPLARALACVAGHALGALGARLLAYGGEGALAHTGAPRLTADLVGYRPSPPTHLN